MNDDDPQTIKRMLIFLYTLDYPDDELSDDPADDAPSTNHLPPHLRRTIPKKLEIGVASSAVSAPSEDNGTVNRTKMMNNVQIYAVAEKYNLPELKELAVRKFESLMTSQWHHANFEQIIKAVFTTTPSKDEGLRRVVQEACSRNFEKILEDDGTRDAVLNDKSLSKAVISAVMGKQEEDKLLLEEAKAKDVVLRDELSLAKLEFGLALENIRTQGARFQAALSKAKSDLDLALNRERTRETVHQAALLQANQSTTRQRQEVLSWVDGKIENINKWEECRNCGDDFESSWIERLGSISNGDYNLQLRCSNCRCRHGL